MVFVFRNNTLIEFGQTQLSSTASTKQTLSIINNIYRRLFRKKQDTQAELLTNTKEVIQSLRIELNQMNEREGVLLKKIQDELEKVAQLNKQVESIKIKKSNLKTQILRLEQKIANAAQN